MPTKTLTAQDVNGDPATSGSNINIVNGSTSTLEFNEIDTFLWTPVSGETVTIDGSGPYTYEFLGYGFVRGDPLQYSAFIRVETSPGIFESFAIDMNLDGDQLPNLSTGNTKLTVADLSTDSPEKFPAPACFTPGTLIDTPDGPMLIEKLQPGDLVTTRDNGPQVIRRIAKEKVLAFGNCAPVVFATGAIGNLEPLIVSQQHGMLVGDWRAQLFCGTDEVLVAAVHLVNGDDIVLREGGVVTYIHLVFDKHQIVFGAGVPSESYLPKAEEHDLLVEDELTNIFGDVFDDLPAARMRVTSHQGRLMAA